MFTTFVRTKTIPNWNPSRWFLRVVADTEQCSLHSWRKKSLVGAPVPWPWLGNYTSLIPPHLVNKPSNTSISNWWMSHTGCRLSLFGSPCVVTLLKYIPYIPLWLWLTSVNPRQYPISIVAPQLAATLPGATPMTHAPPPTATAWRILRWGARPAPGRHGTQRNAWSVETCLDSSFNWRNGLWWFPMISAAVPMVSGCRWGAVVVTSSAYSA